MPASPRDLQRKDSRAASRQSPRQDESTTRQSSKRSLHSHQDESTTRQSSKRSLHSHQKPAASPRYGEAPGGLRASASRSSNAGLNDPLLRVEEGRALDGDEEKPQRLPFDRARCIYNAELACDRELCEPWGKIEITIERAKGLKQQDRFDTMDPYVRIMLDGEEVARTTTKRGNCNPWWDETFDIDVYHPLSTVTLEVYDSDGGTNLGELDILGLDDDLLGGLDFPLDMLPLNADSHGWYILQDAGDWPDTIAARLAARTAKLNGEARDRESAKEGGSSPKGEDAKATDKKEEEKKPVRKAMHPIALATMPPPPPPKEETPAKTKKEKKKDITQEVILSVCFLLKADAEDELFAMCLPPPSKGHGCPPLDLRKFLELVQAFLEQIQPLVNLGNAVVGELQRWITTVLVVCSILICNPDWLLSGMVVGVLCVLAYALLNRERLLSEGKKTDEERQVDKDLAGKMPLVQAMLSSNKEITEQLRVAHAGLIAVSELTTMAQGFVEMGAANENAVPALFGGLSVLAFILWLMPDYWQGRMVQAVLLGVVVTALVPTTVFGRVVQGATQYYLHGHTKRQGLPHDCKKGTPRDSSHRFLTPRSDTCSHDFHHSTFTKPTWCERCAGSGGIMVGFLWGVANQGMVCKECGMVLCKHCLETYWTPRGQAATPHHHVGVKAPQT